MQATIADSAVHVHQKQGKKSLFKTCSTCSTCSYIFKSVTWSVQVAERLEQVQLKLSRVLFKLTPYANF
jgi:hypothetical protein